MVRISDSEIEKTIRILRKLSKEIFVPFVSLSKAEFSVEW